MTFREALRKLFFPAMNRWYVLRLVVVALLAALFFSEVCIPIRVSGISMEPAYANGGFNLIWRPSVLFSGPKRFDVVGVRLAGRRVMLLKRVVAFEGESVEFKSGKLFVNGKELDEPYLRYRGNWTLAERKVDPGKVYVVGDNRAIPMKNHVFGQAELDRIVGVPLW